MWRKHGNRVQRTRFPCMETDFIELVFHVWKTSSLNSWKTSSLNLFFHHKKLHDLLQTQPTIFCTRQRSDQANPWELSSMNSFANNLTLWSRPFWSKPVGAEFMENEFNELGFCTWKPSSLNSISMFSPHQFFLNRVHWTRIVVNEISLKRLLINDIVWVL